MRKGRFIMDSRRVRGEPAFAGRQAQRVICPKSCEHDPSWPPGTIGSASRSLGISVQFLIYSAIL